VKQTKQKGRRREAPVPFWLSRLVFTPVPRKGEKVLNLGIDELRLQPRDELRRLHRASPYHPQPAGNSQNEQQARVQLHARNEADLGDGRDGAANDPDEAPADGRAQTHWTRILHHDLFGANDLPAADAARGVRALVARALHAAAGWIALG
jgi:hypothetical protein